MKTTLSHLPEDKQEELKSLAEIILEKVPAEMIILFGSHARGDWVEDLQ
jgi:predicted nucleotidyltransferase